MWKRWVVGALACGALCSETFVDASPGPRVTRIHVKKSEHRLVLFAGERPLATYRVAIGPGGTGPKRQEGDQVTPVGRYHILHKQPSQFHIFMLLDYPNASDRERFVQLKREGVLGRDATIGGAVGIHGAPRQSEWKSNHKDYDWTLGCVAVDDDEIESIAASVAVGTVVDIED